MCMSCAYAASCCSCRESLGRDTINVFDSTDSYWDRLNLRVLFTGELKTDTSEAAGTDRETESNLITWVGGSADLQQWPVSCCGLMICASKVQSTVPLGGGEKTTKKNNQTRCRCFICQAATCQLTLSVFVIAAEFTEQFNDTLSWAVQYHSYSSWTRQWTL